MVNEKKFRVALINRGMNQTDLAMRLGIHPTTLTGIVRGWGKARPDIRQRMSEILEVPESEIFSSDDSTAPQPNPTN